MVRRTENEGRLRGVSEHSRRLTSLLIIGCVVVWVAAGLAGCSEDSDPVGANELSLLEFINGISPYPSPAPAFDRPVGAPGDSTISGTGGVQVCTVEKFEMGRNMDEVVAFAPTAVGLWPGSIVQGEYVNDGLLVPVSAVRSSCTVGIDLPGLAPDERSAVITQPNQFTVRGALDGIVDTFLTRGLQKDAEFTFTHKETHSFEQGLLAIGISVDWSGGDMQSQFGYSWSSVEHMLLLKFTQKYYTATVVPPASPTAFFDSSVKPSALSNYTGPGNPMCYVQSVTYGRLGILSMTSSESSSKMTAALSAAFNSIFVDGTIDVSAEHEQILQESTMKLLILGGDGTQAVENLADPITGLLNWITSGIELGPSTRGVPISYTVAHLKDNTIARFQYTTDFTRRTCAWADQPLYVSFYKMKCEGSEGGAWPALEGWWDAWVYIDIPGLDRIEKHDNGTFGDFDPGEFRNLTSASWHNPMPSQAGAKVTLRIKIVEDDDVSANDNMGDKEWVMEYPAFNPGSGDCDPDPNVCFFEEVFESGNQRIRVYWKLDLNQQP